MATKYLPVPDPPLTSDEVREMQSGLASAQLVVDNNYYGRDVPMLPWVYRPHLSKDSHWFLSVLFPVEYLSSYSHE